MLNKNNKKTSIENFDKLLKIEQINKKKSTFRVKKLYIDIADDLKAGILLGQIIYWYLPSQKSNKTKLRVKKEGKLWLAKHRKDWHDEIRLTARQFDRAFKKLSQKDLVVKKNFIFAGKKINHIRLQIDNLIEAANKKLKNINQKTKEKEIIKPFNQTVKPVLPKSEENLQNGKTITENLTKNELNNKGIKWKKIEKKFKQMLDIKKLKNYHIKQIDKIHSFVAKGLDLELIIKKMEDTELAPKPSTKYCVNGLKKWLKKEITSIDCLNKNNKTKSSKEVSRCNNNLSDIKEDDIQKKLNEMNRQITGCDYNDR